jgi:nitroreductase
VDVRQAIEQRRSINAFVAGHRLPEQEVAELMRLVRLAPSAFNLQHCRYVLVDDPDLRRRLRAASYDQAQVTDAALLVVICADLHAWRKRPERYWSHAGDDVRRSMVRGITEFYGGDEQLQRDEAMRSCGIAAQTLMLAAQGLGHDSCPMDGYEPEKVARLINLPPDHVLGLFVAIGKAREPAIARGGFLPPEEVFISNTF